MLGFLRVSRKQLLDFASEFFNRLIKRGYGVKFLGRGDTMTKLLERAVEKVRKLPDLEQDAIAALILEELEDEARWEKAFAHSQDALAKLAQEAMAEDKT